jgi:hypothetical protein
MHEIGHALGFSSNLIWVDGVHAGLFPDGPEELVDYALESMDLFRYSTESLPLLDHRPGGNPYFSIDGGATRLARFATGESFGDGWQPGHWSPDEQLGIMSANLPDGQIYHVTPLDLLAMDVIGWDLVADGDLNDDNVFGVEDIDLLSVPTDDLVFDMNRDGLMNEADRAFWIHVFADTFFGDANLDSEFNTSDLVAVFIAGEYEDTIEGNSTWSTGDWNGDGEFNTSDLVLAFQDGGYGKGPQDGANVVPEPSIECLLSLAGISVLIRKRRRRCVFFAH